MTPRCLRSGSIGPLARVAVVVLALALGLWTSAPTAGEPGTTPAPTPASNETEAPGAAQRAAALLQPFKQDLQQALREGLARGPVEAVAACRLRAPEIARAQSRDGVRLGRSSHRLRNPANAPPDWVAPVIDDWLTHPEDRAPRTLPLGEGRTGYVEPILLQPLCLSCHGDAIAPDLAARIEHLYPEDRATGFHVGELRGVFWVELPDPD
ncbi:MAG TPA: DUF3365 domain-containing protein [Myxococcota bacterium]|nr:DUF3365 domain-containing protein [Myxococcales bacterium]HPG24250.1 DUF3365 domain-containing protein [Myxococcota bacterium]